MLKEQIWDVADGPLTPDTKAVTVRSIHFAPGFVCSGRYGSTATAWRSARSLAAKHPESNVYVVIRGRGDDLVVYADRDTIL